MRAIGAEVGSQGTVTVTGAGSTWNSMETLRVGEYGTGSLTIADGGSVTNAEGYVGSEPTSQGTVTVTGTDSLWSSGSLSVGSWGDGTLTVAEGARVTSPWASIGELDSQGTVIVTGAGSAWINTSWLHVGSGGTGTLSIAGGANVTNGHSTIGWAVGSQGTVTVTGADSAWNNNHELWIGYQGTGMLTIADGGTVTSPGAMIGLLRPASSTVLVTGTGSAWNNSGALWVGRGHLGTGTLSITDGASVHIGTGLIIQDAGTLNLDGGTIRFDDYDSIGTFNYHSGTIQLAGDRTIGTDAAISDLFGSTVGAGKTLAVEGGAAVASSFTVASAGSFSIGDDLIVGATGTLNLDGGIIRFDGYHRAGTFNYHSGTIQLAGDRTIGADAAVSELFGSTVEAGKSLVVEGGAAVASSFTVASAGSFSVGAALNVVDTSTLVLSGPQSSLVSTGPLRVAPVGTASMTIQDGASAASSQASIGDGINSHGQATITGAGSTWHISDPDQPSVAELWVGNRGTATLSIADGGSVTTRSGYVGLGSGSEGTATVTGTGSIWSMSGELRVGSFGTGTLNIADSGSVTNTWGWVGGQAGSHGMVTVTGPGSTWHNSEDLYVGASGTGTLDIADGGSVTSVSGRIAWHVGSEGTVTVTGADSTWNTIQALHVGRSGAGTLSIMDGGSVHVGATLVIDGGGTLNLQAGGTVHAHHFDHAAGTFNFTGGTLRLTGVLSGELNAVPDTGTLVLSGYQARLTNTGPLAVAPVGTASMTIEGGASATNTWARIGDAANSHGQVTVTGAGSTWHNSEELHVGESGTGTLSITDGGRVHVGTTLVIGDGGTLNLNGGALRLDGYERSGAFNFLVGTIQLAGDRILAGGASLDGWYGPDVTIPAHKGLVIEGNATLLQPVTLTGGHFGVGDIVGGHLLNFQSGTFQMREADLVIGSGQLGSTIHLNAGQHIVVDHTASLSDSGLLVIDNSASFTAGHVDNAGHIVLDGVSARLRGDLLSNAGLVQGRGRVDTSLHNLPAGEVRVAAGEHLHFTAAGNTNAGVVNVLGGQAEFTQGLANVGTVNLHAGASLFGEFDNTGLVNVGGQAAAGLFGSVTHNGEIHIGQSAVASFYGDVSGAGAFTGPGTAEFLAAYSPGNSTVIVSFAGDVTLGPGATLIIELAGTTPGSGHDRLDIAGHLQLEGTLDVRLIDAFRPQSGDAFNILNFASHGGTFHSLGLPTLDTGLGWNIDELYTQGMLSVSLALLLGDMNLDGVLDTGDVAPFVLALTNPAAYMAQFGVDAVTMTGLGDINADGAFDTADVAPFVRLLVGGGSASVPEPGSLALLGLGTLMLLRRRRTVD